MTIKVLTKVEVQVCVFVCACMRTTVTQQLKQAPGEMEGIFSASYVHTCAHVYTYYESWPSPGSKMFMMSPENSHTHTCKENVQ